jgi:hypothetical protein
MSAVYRLVASPMPAGSKSTLFYWIDIPRGQHTQAYDGSIYLMVNATEEY